MEIQAEVLTFKSLTFFSQETGEPVGTVINVFDSGANDLLEVVLDSSFDILDATGKQKSAGTKESSHHVWVPFVEAIVPVVDLKKGEMQITPPKGLLELNLRYDERSKKERRQLVRHTLLVSYAFFTSYWCQPFFFMSISYFLDCTFCWIIGSWFSLTSFNFFFGSSPCVHLLPSGYLYVFLKVSRTIT